MNIVRNIDPALIAAVAAIRVGKRKPKKAHVVNVCCCGEQASATAKKQTVIMTSIEDRWLLDYFTWDVRFVARTAYAYSPTVQEYFGFGASLHSVIFEASLVDHKDLNGLNNMRPNLRASNRSLNGANTRGRPKSRWPYKGVRQDKRPLPKSWEARISVDTRPVFLGRFETAEEAARAYDDAARARYGEHARLNFPLAHEAGV